MTMYRQAHEQDVGSHRADLPRWRDGGIGFKSHRRRGGGDVAGGSGGGHANRPAETPGKLVTGIQVSLPHVALETLSFLLLLKWYRFP